MANSNITNNAETANSNGELVNVVSSASLVTSKNQQTKTSDTITHQLTTSTANSTANSTPQVITVVASTSSNQPQAGQPVVLQVANNAQFIALVQSDRADSNGNALSVSADEEQSSNFDELCSSSYSNGNALTYYTDSSFTQSSNYFPNSTNQVLGDGAYLVMEPSENNLSPSQLNSANHLNKQSTDGLGEEDLKQLIQLQQQRSISVQPTTVKWLIDNYESAEGTSLPRSALYTHYNEHCQQNNLEPVNAASFGKFIRSVFIGLRTRRLGTRGNSKYHYYGIRVKPGSALSKTVDQTQICNNSPTTITQQQPPTKKQKTASSSNNNNTSSNYNKTNNNNSNCVIAVNDASQQTLDELKTYLGDPTTLLQSVWPDVPTISSSDSDSPNALLNRFAFCYRKHYEQVINAIGNLQFNQVEQLWIEFWQSTNHHDKEALTLEQLHNLTIPNSNEESGEDESFNSLANWIVQTDYTLYNSLITSLLLPNLLKPIPGQLSQQIRNFAKNMVSWMKQSLTGYNNDFIDLKCAAVSAFSHTLKRYTSLNHLSNAARTSLQNYVQVQQMISDLSKVDFKNLQEQANWVCDCEVNIVNQIESTFKSFLQEQLPSEKWSFWCEQVVELCLQDNHEMNYCKKFYFIWKLYTSLVMRDLTLRSAPSFGSFHLIHLLFDEYIFYLIEHRVAKACNKTSLQVLQESQHKKSKLN